MKYKKLFNIILEINGCNIKESIPERETLTTTQNILVSIIQPIVYVGYVILIIISLFLGMLLSPIISIIRGIVIYNKKYE